MSFDCNQCGACCIVSNPFTGAGRCPKLTLDNKCSIYDTRPTVCRVDDMADIRKIPRPEAYAINYQACEKLREIAAV